MNFSSDLSNRPNGNAPEHASHVDNPANKPTDQARPDLPSSVDEHGAYHFELPDALNLYFKIGCRTFTRHELLAYGGMDSSRVENCLNAWEARGLIQMLTPLAGAGDGEIVAKQLRQIDCLTPLSKKTN